MADINFLSISISFFGSLILILISLYMDQYWKSLPQNKKLTNSFNEWEQ